MLLRGRKLYPGWRTRMRGKFGDIAMALLQASVGEYQGLVCEQANGIRNSRKPYLNEAQYYQHQPITRELCRTIREVS